MTSRRSHDISSSSSKNHPSIMLKLLLFSVAATAAATTTTGVWQRTGAGAGSRRWLADRRRMNPLASSLAFTASSPRILQPCVGLDGVGHGRLQRCPSLRPPSSAPSASARHRFPCSPASAPPVASSSSYPPYSLASSISNAGIELADLLYDSTSTAFEAWEWTSNLGAPAALVAGAVLVTLSETREEASPRKSDDRTVRLAKKAMRFLLLSSFAFEVVSIFVGTVTGTVLLSHGSRQAARKMVGYGSPLELLKYHHEFEYLTIQIGFLQGLFNWLAAVALEILIPKDGETKSARRMNRALASWLLMLTLWITAFYNHHLPFYSDYWTTLKRYAVLFVQRFFFCTPMRPLSFLYGPAIVVSTILTWRAFRSPPGEDE